MTKQISLVLFGQLELWDQEGGNAHPTVTIGQQHITSEIEEMIRESGLKMETGLLGGATHEGIADGQWILTLVRYKP